MANNAPVELEALQAAVDAAWLYPSQLVAAEALGIPRGTYQGRLRMAESAGLRPRIPEYQSRALATPREIAKPRQGVRRVIVTSAQDDATDIHRPFWQNLKAYAAHLKAEIIVGGFTYQHRLFTDHTSAHGRYHHELIPHLANNRVHVGGQIAICAEMNTLPTAVRPLSGLQTYSGELHGVFPHAKVQLQSVPRQKTKGAKINVTTGTVTLPNYIPKKAGMKAQFHHVFGALLIEVDGLGRSWMRHLLADEDTGAFYDLDTLVSGGEVTGGHRISTLVSEVHFEKANPSVLRAAFGYDLEQEETIPDGNNLLDTLRPEHHFFHDVADFTNRNHHNRNDIHFKFERWVAGEESVEKSFRQVARFLEKTRRAGTESVVVSSNHHGAYLRWLKESDIYAKDQPNALFFLRSQVAVYEAIADNRTDFDVFEWALRSLSSDRLKGVRFPGDDDSIVVHGIEHALHGHIGANGSKGSPLGFANMGPKINAGHFHSPQILDGAYFAGVCQLEMGYNKGASGWAVAHIVTYQNGKRALIFLVDGKWKA